MFQFEACIIETWALKINMYTKLSIVLILQFAVLNLTTQRKNYNETVGHTIYMYNVHCTYIPVLPPPFRPEVGSEMPLAMVLLLSTTRESVWVEIAHEPLFTHTETVRCTMYTPVLRPLFLPEVGSAMPSAVVLLSTTGQCACVCVCVCMDIVHEILFIHTETHDVHCTY